MSKRLESNRNSVVIEANAEMKIGHGKETFRDAKVGDVFPTDARDGLITGHTHPTWYALLTPPHKEKAAREYLKAHDVHAFYPDEIRERYLPGGKRRRYEAPIVAGYVFGRFEGHPRWHVLKQRPFFRGVVSLGGEPYPMSRPTIRRMQGLTLSAADRKRELREKREAARRALEPREGERAEITDGPLAGFMVDVRSISGGMAHYIMPNDVKGQAPLAKLERRPD